MICNLGVVGSNPTRGSKSENLGTRECRQCSDFIEGSFQSGQMGQTVNLLAYAYGGSNPSLPTTKKGGNVVETYLKQHYRLFFKSAKSGSSSVGRASAFQAEGREFEPRLPLD